MLVAGFFGQLRADVEPGNNSAATTTDVLSPTGSQAGTLSPTDQDDYYKVITTADGKLTISVSNISNEYMYLYLLDSDGGTVLGSTSGYAQLTISFSRDGLAAGTYYVRVYSSSVTSYSVSSAFTNAGFANDAEPNDDPAQALTITNNNPVQGHIKFYNNGGSTDNDDYYIYTTSADGNITVSLQNDNNGYVYIYLYDIDGVTLLGSTSGYAQSVISFVSNGLGNGTYYVRVQAASFSAYSLNVTLDPNTYVNDGANNNSFNAAVSFPQNSSSTGHIAYRYNNSNYDTDDFFSFYSNGDYNITINLSNNTNGYTYIYLYDTDTSTVLGSTSGYAQGGISFTTNGLAAGTYYIRVTAGPGNFSGYTISNSYTANPLANDAEPNNTPATAITTTYNATDIGHIAYRQTGGGYDNDDYYVFTTPVDGDILFSLVNNNNAYCYLYLLDSDGTTVLGSTSGYAGSPISFSSNGLAAGTYYARVYGGNNNFSGYELSKTLTSTSFTNDTEPNDVPATALPFNINSTVNGHLVHRYNGGSYDNNDYYIITTTSDGNISLSASNTTNNYLYMYLLDSDGTTQLASASGYAQLGITCSYSGLAAGTYYVLLYGGNNNFCGYTLTNTFTPTPYLNDPEPNNSTATATLLNNNPIKTGHIGHRYNGGSTDLEDFWQINMLSADSFKLDVNFVTTNYVYVYLYNSASNQIYGSSGYGGTYSIAFASLPAGTYYLRVYGTQYNAYTLTGFYWPCDPVASVITAGGPTTFCQGGSVGLNLAGAYNNYLWSTGATTGSIAATSTGSYFVTAYDFDGCPHLSNSISVTALPNATWYADNDGDSYGNPGTSQVTCTGAPSGYVANNTDCNDNNAAINPAATETCNGIDDDCDGSADDGLTFSTWYADADGDNYGNAATTTTACSQPSGYVSNGTDCNDNNGAINPGATENCNGIDDDCDGLTDEGCGTYTWFIDADGDTYGNPSISTTTVTPTAPSGYVANNLDCNDNNASINPAATEVCNGIDDDCDGVADDGLTFLTYYTDADGDNYGSSAATGVSSCSLVAGSVTNNLDCNDNSSAVNPAAAEVCNGIDDDCDGIADDGLTFLTYYTDADGDNYGSSSATGVSSCSPVAGSVTNNLDCNDNSASINPASAEICNGIDDDCDGNADDGLTFTTYYADADGDNYGNVASSTQTCNGAPSGYVSNSNDCDDNNTAVNPAATEVCNSIDDNCDGVTDEGCGGCGAPGPISGPASLCAPTGQQITYSVATVPGASAYNWTVPSGTIIVSGQGTNTLVVRWPFSVIHSGLSGDICVTYTATCGTSAPSCLPISIQLSIPVRPNSISGNALACDGDIVTYSVAALARATTYNWTVPAGATITNGQGTNIITVQYNNAFAGGSISVSASNGCGTSPERLKTVARNILKAPASINGLSNGVCGASGVGYTCAIVPGATSYYWSVPAGASIQSGQGTSSIVVDFSGSYTSGTISVNAANGCGNGAARSMSVKAIPGQPGIISGSVATCTNTTETYEIAAMPGVSNYNWTVPSGFQITSGQGTKTIQVLLPSLPAMNKTISVKASNNCGTGNGRQLTGINSLNCTRMATTEHQITGIYPNPAQSQFNIEINANDGISLEMNILDLSGRIVLAQTFEPQPGKTLLPVDIQSLPQGVYLVQMTTTSGTVTMKLVKE